MKRLALLLPMLALVLAFGGFAAQPTAAQNATWRAQFFNNPFLLDPAAVTATYDTINFDWGTGRPIAGIPADNFSARFAADVYFTAGTYRFTITADDAFQLGIDQRSVIYTFDAPTPGATRTVDVQITEGVHTLQLDFREATGNAYLKLSWINLSAVPTPQPVTGGGWLAQYYNNPNLAGSPTATINEADPSHNWGLGGPSLSGIPADNFSVRWTTTRNLPAGDYFIQVNADDGVRVFVNGIGYINEWRLATGQGYTAGFTLPGGNTTIVVEYFEAGFNAFINFQFSGPTNVATPAPAGATATVTTGMLNVRNAPSAVNTQILTKIRQGQTVPIVGKNQAGTWWQVNANGVTGWVSGAYVTTINAGNVPVVGENPIPVTPVQPGANTVTTISNLKLRPAPNTANRELLVIPRGGTAQVIARTGNNAWYQVNYNGVIGWVSSAYVRGSLNLTQIPVQ